MKRSLRQPGFSLVELLTVIAVIAVLLTLVVAYAARFRERAQEDLTNSAIAVIRTALQQYRQVYEDYPFVAAAHDEPAGQQYNFGEGGLVTVHGLTVAPDCAGYPEYASSEALYYSLSRAPESRRLVETIADSMKTSRTPDGLPRRAATPDGDTVVLMRFVDAWGRSLRYLYLPQSIGGAVYQGVPRMNAPRIVSAGADGLWGTDDDLDGSEG